MGKEAGAPQLRSLERSPCGTTAKVYGEVIPSAPPSFE